MISLEFDTEEGKSRYFILTFLKHRESNQMFVFFNVHAGHSDWSGQFLFALRNIKKYYPASNIIVSGDFNADEIMMNSHKFYQVNLKFTPSVPNGPKTCCFARKNAEGKFTLDPAWSEFDQPGSRYDHVFNNMGFINEIPNIYELDVYKGGIDENQLESDHIPVFAQVHINFHPRLDAVIAAANKEYVDSSYINFYFVRHGESKFNEEMKRSPYLTYITGTLGYIDPTQLVGQDLRDPALTEKGEVDAVSAAEILQGTIATNDVLIFVSPLHRAIQTAWAIVGPLENVKRIYKLDALTEVARCVDCVPNDEGFFDGFTKEINIGITRCVDEKDYASAFAEMAAIAEKMKIKDVIIVGHSKWFQDLSRIIYYGKFAWRESSWIEFIDNPIGNGHVVSMMYYPKNGGGRFANKFHCHPKEIN